METLKFSKPKARKEHKCNFCCQKINIGETYDSQTNVYDGDLYTWKTHLDCSAIAQKLKMYDDADEGVGSDDFWEHINNALFYLPDDILPAKPTPQEKLDLVIKHFLKEEKIKEKSDKQ